MIEKKLCKITAIVDEDATRRLYADLPSLKSTDSASANFLANIHLRQAALNAYFEPLGIDAGKCAGLWVLDVDPYRQCASYSGCYPFAGEITGMDKLGDPEDVNSAWFGFEKTELGFELSFFHDGNRPQIDFCVEMPWLFDPPITIGRYINRNRLPEQWRPLCSPTPKGEGA